MPYSIGRRRPWPLLYALLHLFGNVAERTNIFLQPADLSLDNCGL